MLSYTLPFQTDIHLSKNKNLWLFILTWMTATTFLVSCEQGPNGLGAGVLPEGDLINVIYTDTISIDLQTIVVDSINTYQATNQLVGNYIDPQFGTISAKTFTQVFPRSGLNFGDPADLIFDSLVLKLTFNNFYGRLDQPQILRVYEITEQWPDTIVIYSNTELAHSTEDLGNGRQLTFSEDEVLSGTVRTRLSDELGERILFGDSTILSDRDLFLNDVLKGLVFETDPVQFINREPGAILSMFGGTSDSLLILHYQKFDESTQTYLSFQEPFLITNSTPRFHSLARTDFESTLFGQLTATGDTSDRFEFIESGLFTKTWVRFPTINFDEPFLVSRASLVLPVDPDLLGSEDRYSPPLQILALRADETGTEIVENNLGLSVSSNNVSLVYDADRQAYIIPITGYFQSLFNGSIEDDNGFTILPVNARSAINRAILAGTKHPNPDLRPKLELTVGSIPR